MEHMPPAMTQRADSRMAAVAIVTAVWLGLFVLRLAGPSDMLDKDQMLSE